MRKVLLILGFCFPVFLIGQSVDSVALKRVDSLIQVSREATNKREFDKALEVNTIAEKLALEKWGKESVAYAKACFNHGRILDNKGAYAESVKWYLESKTIREKVLGKEHPDYVLNIYILALIYMDLSEFKQSETLFLETLAIREKKLGKEHADYTSALNDLAVLYDEMEEYAKAISVHLEAISIKAKTRGKEHPDYATSVNNLGLVYLKTGEYEKAQPLLLAGKTIREKTLGKVHSLYASSLDNLSRLYSEMGNYEQAIPLCSEAKDIREKSLGKSNPRYASSVNNLASLYGQLGDYEKAEALFTEALAIKKNIQGGDNPDYARSLGNLAIVHRRLGNFDKSEALNLEEIAIFEKTVGKENSNYLSSVAQLGVLYFDKMDYKKAEMIKNEVKNLAEKILPKEHPLYFESLSNLANVYLATKNYSKAEPLFLEVKARMESVLGKTHPDYATNLSNLGVLNYELGNYDKANALYLEVLLTHEQAFGKIHPDYVATLKNLARLNWTLKKFNTAKNYLLEAGEIERKLLTNAARYLSESELSFYIQTFSDGLNHDFSFNQNQPIMNAACYDDVLFSKGYLLNGVSKLRKSSIDNPKVSGKFYELNGYQRRLAAEYSKPIDERKNVTELEEKANTLEKDLARSIAGFSEVTQQVTWQEVQQKLKSNEAAIEFIHYQFVNPNSTDSLMYAALVLRPGMKQPAFIPLFEAKQLDTLLKAQGKTKPEYINQLYALSNQKKSLYQLIWKPLEQELIGASTVYYSPSGLLHRLNLNAIPVPTPTLAQNKNQSLAERYQLIELGSTRQLVIAAPKTTVDTTNAKNTIAAQLYGSIQYEMDSSATKIAAVDMNKNTTASRGIDFGLADSTLRGGKWTYLKWTEVEINSLELILTDAGLKADVHKAFAATEESFKRIGAEKPSPRIVHLATHGFFFPDPKLQAKNEPTLNGANEPVFKISEHPMIRSGLILSGGNHAWQTGKPLRPGFEDGILTAYEISQMNLSNTELVVLSACETGLGDIQGNEGVYGLQRAFKIAGAKYLVMSLWQVPDFHTQELMTTFYSKWLEDKMSIPDAFRAAQKVMKDKFKEPFYWAGFVLVE